MNFLPIQIHSEILHTHLAARFLTVWRSRSFYIFLLLHQWRNGEDVPIKSAKDIIRTLLKWYLVYQGLKYQSKKNQIPLSVKVKYFIDKHVYSLAIFLCVHNICTFISGLAAERQLSQGIKFWIVSLDYILNIFKR